MTRVPPVVWDLRSMPSSRAMMVSTPDGYGLRPTPGGGGGPGGVTVSRYPTSAASAAAPQLGQRIVNGNDSGGTASQWCTGAHRWQVGQQASGDTNTCSHGARAAG